jgi:hypothetical protein
MLFNSRKPKSVEPFIPFKNKLNAWGVAIHALKMRTFTPHQIWTNIRTEEKEEIAIITFLQIRYP